MLLGSTSIKVISRTLMKLSPDQGEGDSIIGSIKDEKLLIIRNCVFLLQNFCSENSSAPESL